MFALERQSRILSMLEKEKSILVQDAASLFHVTEETIRRDLRALESQGLLIRTHGGAMVNESLPSETPLTLREGINIGGKDAIGKKAAELIQDGDTILLDPSTSALHVAKNIKDKKLTVITNAQRIIRELADCPDITLISTGGVYRPKSSSFVGRAAENSVGNYFASKIFFSCSGFSPQTGLIDSNEQDAEMKRAMLRCSAQAIFLCDHTKFGRIGYWVFGKTSDIHTMITDAPVPEEWNEPLAEASVRMLPAKG